MEGIRFLDKETNSIKEVEDCSKEELFTIIQQLIDQREKENPKMRMIFGSSPTRLVDD